MSDEKIIVADLNSGRYTEELTGHELFNLDKNELDGKYYGYVPPNNDVNITKIQSSAKGSVSGVLVVYVQAISKMDKNREIVAYCENATVYATSQSGENMNRDFMDKDGKRNVAPYCIVSDNLIDLRLLPSEHKYIIKIADYNYYMFRKQRSYLEKYPQLKADIISYIRGLEGIDFDDSVEQNKIQNVQPATAKFSSEYGNMPDEIIDTSNGKAIKRNHTVAKKVLVDSQYKCLYDMKHTTFSTVAGNPYMEGHHLIPCTVTNSKLFEITSKLDREENIVCICPNCHKAIHYGDNSTKRRLIKVLFDKQKAKLQSVKIDITLEILFDLYKV